jgi:hypothetical protein
MDFLPPAKRACLAIRTYGVLVQVHTYAYAHYRSLIRILFDTHLRLHSICDVDARRQTILRHTPESGVYR